MFRSRGRRIFSAIPTFGVRQCRGPHLKIIDARSGQVMTHFCIMARHAIIADPMCLLRRHRLIDEVLGPGSGACAQSEDGDFRRAVKTERHADGANTAIDVQTHAAKLKPALIEFLAHSWKNKGADQR